MYQGKTQQGTCTKARHNKDVKGREPQERWTDPYLNKTAGRDSQGPPARGPGGLTQVAPLPQQRRVRNPTALPTRSRAGTKQPAERILKPTARANSEPSKPGRADSETNKHGISHGTPGQPSFNFARDGQTCNNLQIVILCQRQLPSPRTKPSPSS